MPVRRLVSAQTAKMPGYDRTERQNFPVPQLLVRPDRNDPNPLILYHGRRCPDGFGAALAAWLFYEGQAEFRGLDHGEIQTADDLGELAGRAVYVLDFAFEPTLGEIESRVAKLVVLDHHKSAAETQRLPMPMRRGAFRYEQVRRASGLGVFPGRQARARSDSLHRGPRYLEMGIPRKRGVSRGSGYGARAQL
jgi:hypothetical protein